MKESNVEKKIINIKIKIGEIEFECSGNIDDVYYQKKEFIVGCLDDIKNKKVKKYKKRKTAEKHIEEIKDSASFEKKYNKENIICEIVEVEE